MKSFLYLASAILFETFATSILKKTENFTKPFPSVLFVVFMGFSFYMLSLALKGIPIGIAYAIWSAVGIIFISLIGFFVYKEKLDFPAVLGILFIIVGVVIINVFSETNTHT
ncbi:MULTISPECIES: multidrug efflux SMR transporter [Weeksella]|uniref:DMT family transporter n=1 Tax=Weeksella TaxID=1013 RepID=UPI0008A54316|nr:MULTISPECIES: multidrug efflux SMR transporter [Weeksella]MDK7375110.1 multidrug efflux SMR transporter [Weeksella virosa]OFM85355.1 transporter [Weeksella sp. HMSC059D05]